MLKKDSLLNWPDEKGYFGKFGGRYVAETLMPLILEVEKEYNATKKNTSFKKELDYYLKKFVGRPSPTSPPELVMTRAAPVIFIIPNASQTKIF